MVFNLLATLCINCPENGQNLAKLQILKTLLEYTKINKSIDLTKFALSCFVEVLYSNKGKKYSSIVCTLRSITDTQFDQLIRYLVSLGRVFKDSETIGIWNVLIKMLASVPRQDEYLVEMMVSDGLLSVCMDQMAEKAIQLNVKGQILDSLDMILRIQNIPK